MPGKNASTFKPPLGRTSDGNINTPAAAERPCEQAKRALEEPMEQPAELNINTNTNTNTTNNNTNTNNSDDNDDEAAAAAEQTGEGKQVKNKIAWTDEEVYWALLSRVKYYGEQRFDLVKTAEQEVGVFEYFKQFVSQNTSQETLRTARAIAQKAGEVEKLLRDATSILLNEYVDSKNNSVTFSSLNNGVLQLRTGRKMEFDGEYALIQSFSKVFGLEVSKDAKTAISNMSKNLIFKFWKTYGIANPNLDERYVHVSKSIPTGGGKISDKAPQNRGVGGRRAGRGSGGGSTKKKVRRNDIANEEMKAERLTALKFQMNLQERAMQLKTDEVQNNKDQHGIALASLYPEGHPMKSQLRDTMSQTFLKQYEAKSTPTPSQNTATETDVNIVTLDDSDDDDKDVNVNVANNVSKGDE